MIILSNRTILLIGILGVSAAAWSGFLLGGGTGGSRSAAFMPALSSAASANLPQTTVRPATTWSEAGYSQKNDAVLADSTTQAATTASSSTSFSNESREVSPAASAFTAPAKVHRPQGNAAAQAPPRYPVVMLDLPSEALRSNPGLLTTIDNLREKFIASIGGTDQNPADPNYLARWIQGAASIDDQLKAAIGWQAYNDLQIAHYNSQNAAH